MTDFNLNECLVYSNGRVDIAATCEKVTAELETVQTKRDELFAQIAPSVDAVFDQYPGAHINTPALLSQVAMTLGADVTTLQQTEGLVKEYVKANSEGEGALFTIKRGKGGGVCRNKPEDQEVRAKREAAKREAAKKNGTSE